MPPNPREDGRIPTDLASSAVIKTRRIADGDGDDRIEGEIRLQDEDEDGEAVIDI